MSLLLYCVRLPVVAVSYIILVSHGFEPVGLRLSSNAAKNARCDNARW